MNTPMQSTDTLNPTPQQPEQAQPLVRFAGVTKRYGELTVLDGLDEDDALERGFSLAELAPPRGIDDEALPEHMIRQLGGRA